MESGAEPYKTSVTFRVDRVAGKPLSSFFSLLSTVTKAIRSILSIRVLKSYSGQSATRRGSFEVVDT